VSQQNAYGFGGNELRPRKLVQWVGCRDLNGKTKSPGLLSLWSESHGFNIREETMLRRLIPLTFVLAGASAALADDMKMPTNSADLKWGPAPAALPKGAEITVLSGDPSSDGLYVVRLKVPDGYKIPAHNHPTTEYVTVISGNFHLGMGDKLDEKNGIELTAGGYGEAPAKMNHYAWASSPSVIQVHGQGPFAITYVNPADDPSKQ
jgi:quercetin dioxygenase-like cupin family protein